MAFPVIILNSNGSGGVTSGAGPGDGTSSGSALTGTTNASTDGAGTTVTLPSGTDLSNVATDGSHACYIHDTTAGHRRWSKITGKAGSGGATPTVTVNEAYTINLTNKTWGIGGQCAGFSSGTVNCQLLFDNNTAAGDAMPGWKARMLSGHSETLSATLNLRRAGDTTSGPIVLEGVAGAATTPLLTFSNNGDAIVPRANYQQVRYFELQNSNGTKTASRGIAQANAIQGTLLEGIKVDNSTNKFWRGIVTSDGSNTGCQVISCRIGYCADVGLQFGGAGAQNSGGMKGLFNDVHDCGNDGIKLTTNTWLGWVLIGNRSYNNAGIGISYDGNRTDDLDVFVCALNTLDNNTSDGMKIITAAASIENLVIFNNIFSNNGGYGVNFSSGTFTDAYLNAFATMMRGNNFFNNTSGPTNPSSLTINQSSQTFNPLYANRAGGDFSVGALLDGMGYPGGSLAVGTYSATYSFPTPGAAQRKTRPLHPVRHRKGDGY